MARTKTTTLFNKNHISLIQYVNGGNMNNVITFTDPSWSTKKNSNGNWKFSEKTLRIDTWVNKAVYRSLYRRGLPSCRGWRKRLR